jgi:hypothetical protein
MGMFTTTIKSDKYFILKWSTPSSKIYKKNIDQCKILSEWQFSFLEKFDPIPKDLTQKEMMDMLTDGILDWKKRFLKLGIVKYVDGWSKNVLIMKKNKENLQYQNFLIKNKPEKVEIKEHYKASNYYLSLIK